MNIKQQIRTITILGLFIFWVVSALSGIILYFLPGGPRTGRMIILGFQKRVWVQIHSVAGFLTVIITGLHIILEWPVLVALIKQLFKRKD